MSEEELNDSWTRSETVNMLKLINKYENWETVSESLGTNKTPEQCWKWFEFLETMYSALQKRKRSKPQGESRRKRRKATQIERLYKCQEKYCKKSYGTEGALKMHLKIKHPHIEYDEVYQQQARRAMEDQDYLAESKYDLSDSDSFDNRSHYEEQLIFENHVNVPIPKNNSIKRTFICEGMTISPPRKKLRTKSTRKTTNESDLAGALCDLQRPSISPMITSYEINTIYDTEPTSVNEQHMKNGHVLAPVPKQMQINYLVV
eukprot:TRINITY_DN5373_c0_g2_i1.p1 TRINITY_DN5373_c0_g2~~TRINITY_DN5373_c0_g2_i1.p1  ORF type:complete len:261 (+),score=31.85 TRINITY_DN5373_c0_g2_i1:300-1082(+)